MIVCEEWGEKDRPAIFLKVENVFEKGASWAIPSGIERQDHPLPSQIPEKSPSDRGLPGPKGRLTSSQ